MELEPQINKEHLLATCPNCRQETLYLVQINVRKLGSKTEQILTCRSCRLMVPVDEFKNLICVK